VLRILPDALIPVDEQPVHICGSPFFFIVDYMNIVDFVLKQFFLIFVLW